jgi:DNA adenine methylase
MPLRPFFCRVGSKRDIASFVMDYFPDPDTYNTYVEPFIGGGAIFWKKTPTDTEVINDLDKDLIAGYRRLRDVKTRDFRTDLNTAPKLQRFVDGPLRSDMDRLTAQLVTACNTFGAMGVGKIYTSSNPATKLRKLDEYQERLRGVKIENQSYEKIIAKYDGPKTFFYLDPPYEDSGGLYKHSAFDYEALRTVLSKTKGRWLLSINDSPNIRRIFKGFFFKSFTVKAKGSVKIGVAARKELLISNYGSRGG